MHNEEDLSAVKVFDVDPKSGKPCAICPGHGRLKPSTATAIAVCGKAEVYVCSDNNCRLIGQRRAKLYG
jgi:hypothetical protein